MLSAIYRDKEKEGEYSLFGSPLTCSCGCYCCTDCTPCPGSHVRLFTRRTHGGLSQDTKLQWPKTVRPLRPLHPHLPPFRTLPRVMFILRLHWEIPLNFLFVASVLVCCSFSAQFAPQSILLPMHAYTVFPVFMAICPGRRGWENVRKSPENVQSTKEEKIGGMQMLHFI